MRMGRLFLMSLLLVLALPTTLAATRLEAAVGLSGVFVAQPEELPRAVKQTGGEIQEIISPGATLYFQIENARRAQDIKGLRAMVDDFKSGEEMVGLPRIEYRIMYDETGANSLGYRYVVAVPILDIENDEEHLLQAKVAIGTRWVGSVRVSFSAKIQLSSITSQQDSLLLKEDSGWIAFEQLAFLKLIFSEYGRFEFDAHGQGPLYLSFSTQPYTDIAGRYPNANLRFLSFAKTPILNRVGTCYLYASEQEYLYELINGEPVSLNSIYDVEQEAFVFETRRLGEYLIADQWLRLDVPLIPHQNPPVGVK